LYGKLLGKLSEDGNRVMSLGILVITVEEGQPCPSDRSGYVYESTNLGLTSLAVNKVWKFLNNWGNENCFAGTSYSWLSVEFLILGSSVLRIPYIHSFEFFVEVQLWNSSPSVNQMPVPGCLRARFVLCHLSISSFPRYWSIFLFVFSLHYMCQLKMPQNNRLQVIAYPRSLDVGRPAFRGQKSEYNQPSFEEHHSFVIDLTKRTWKRKISA
jgi:hypothetical protein